jgi:hypothetical protein
VIKTTRYAWISVACEKAAEDQARFKAEWPWVPFETPNGGKSALTTGNVARADQYGFTSAPYSYDEEYRGCAWPDNGDGRRYRPGYEEDRKYCREHARELLLTK